MLHYLHNCPYNNYRRSKSISSIGSLSVHDGEYVCNAMPLADVVAGRMHHKHQEDERRRKGAARDASPSSTSFMV